MFLGVPKVHGRAARLGRAQLRRVQFLRLLNNVILTRLLEPSIFGLMSLVVAIRVGMELVSDVGVTQNIVSNPRGHTPSSTIRPGPSRRCAGFSWPGSAP